MRRKLSPKRLLRQIKTQGTAIKIRFIFFFLLVLFAIIFILFLSLNLLGIINPAGSQIEESLNRELGYSVESIYSNIDKLAAYNVAFSKELSEQLADSETAFEDLHDNPVALTDLQRTAYNTLYTNMRLANCSGAFYFINTTVNSSLHDSYLNGIYLKYSNLNSENTVRNSVCMFRGSPEIARENNINLHSSWEYEIKSGTFPQAEAVLNQSESSPSKGYLLTSVYKLPNAWEHVRLLCAPITDDSGNILGVCGFEINDLLFQISYEPYGNTDSSIAYGLLTESDGNTTSQISRGSLGYMTKSTYESVKLVKNSDLSEIITNDDTFVGRTREIEIGQSTHTATAMIPKDYYDGYMRNINIKSAALLFFIALLTVIAGIWMTKRYIHPITDALKQMESEKNETIRKSETLQNELTELRKDNEQTKAKLSHVTSTAKSQIDPDCYALFINHLSSLTPKEREVFSLYVEGKSTKEVKSTLNIGDNGLKYHNKNIYSKLGVSSKKELLLYITIMLQDPDSPYKKMLSH